jgi:outer membrane protein assembly factor BamB
MKRKLLLSLPCLVALLFVAGGCPKKPPTVPLIVQAPDTSWVNAETPVRTYSKASSGGDITYIADLGTTPATIDTVGEGASGETTTVYLTWTATGTYNWKMQAALSEDPTKASAWTDPAAIYILPNEPPAITYYEPPNVAVVDVPAAFTALAQDPEGDSIQFYFDFGDGDAGWVDTMLASGGQLTVFHTYDAVDTVMTFVKARDKKRSVSAPESAEVKIGIAGGVLWYSQPGGLESGDSEPVTTSPVVLILGADTVVIVGGCDDSRLFSLKYRDGRSKGTGTPAVLDEGDFGHPAYCAATAHVICGNEDGRLYAFSNAGLTREWMWPPETSDFHAWGPVAISGDKIYAAKENDTVYCIQDAGQNGNPLGKYYLRRVNMELTVPVIDNTGDVIFGTESCFVYKMDPNLTSPRWSRQLQVSGELHNLCLDAGANVYATSDNGKLYSLNPDGTDRWTLDIDPGRDAWYMAIGDNSMLYVGTGSGKLAGVNYSTGSSVWTLQVSSGELDAGMVYTTKKYLYCLDDEDWLYCVNVSGVQPALVWKVNCPAQIRPRGGRSPGLTSDDQACLCLGPDGDILLIGAEYMFRVAGYADGTLGLTAWPKWQHDLHNTGNVNGP